MAVISRTALVQGAAHAAHCGDATTKFIVASFVTATAANFTTSPTWIAWEGRTRPRQF